MAKKSKEKTPKMKKGGRYVCSVYGLVVTVDKVCGCIEACDIICCGEEMRPKK